MIESDAELILAAGALLAAGLVASLVAGRLRLPSLVLFLAIGMAIGSDGTGWIHFDDYELAQRIGVIALALILFEGGLAAGWTEIRPVLRAALSLAVLGTIVTALVSGFVAAWLFDFSTLEGLLVGAILASTDGAAIFALLRGSTLRRRLARTLEGEAGINDPVAVLLVIGFIDWIQKPDYGLLDMAGLFAGKLAVGGAVGLLVALGAARLFQRAQLASQGLWPVASIATAAVAFGAAEVLHGSGFLAVYLAGLGLGSANVPGRRVMHAFHDGLAWVAQIAMFFTLGLLVFPSQLDEVWLEGTLMAVVVVVVARPAATFLATALSGLRPGEQLVLGWAGLRGAVPVVLATFPVLEGVPHSVEFFNIAFFAVLLSTLLQGTTFEALARRLGATTSEPALPPPLLEVGAIRRLGAEVLEVPVGEEDAVVGHRVRDLGLPRDAILSVIVRDDEALLPRGSTRIEPGDRLHVLARHEVAHELATLRERWRAGPVGPQVGRRPTLRTAPAVFSSGPWREDDGDPARPRSVAGVEVVDHLRTRRDVPGALVALADGRFAITGPVVALGGPLMLREHARRRLGRATSDAERAWWQEVIGALAS